MTFFNTIQSDQEEQALNNAASATQEQFVLSVMRKLKRAAYFEVQAELPTMNRDSLKRSLTCLQTKEFIYKDTVKANMVMGPHKKRCHQYVLIEKTESNNLT